MGYAGGAKPNPTYQEVCGDGTGHAEVVLIEFDPKTISYDKLLGMFWDSHDPTQGNRQGFDVGSQYRSAIYATTEAQFKTATAAKQRLTETKKFKKPVTTEIRKGIQFFMAEDYHQQYVDKRNGVAACPIPGLSS